MSHWIKVSEGGRSFQNFSDLAALRCWPTVTSRSAHVVCSLQALLVAVLCMGSCGLLRKGLHLQEYLFRGIQKSEWQNLFAFIQAKRLRIENLREAELGPAGGGGVTALDLGDDIDTGQSVSQSITSFPAT